MLKWCSAARAATQHNLKTNVHPVRQPIADGQGPGLGGLPVCSRQLGFRRATVSHCHPPVCDPQALSWPCPNLHGQKDAKRI